MKTLNKIILLVFLQGICASQGYAQDSFLESANVFATLPSVLQKIFISATSLDDTINKHKVKNMALELSNDISQLIEVKNDMLHEIQANRGNNPDYQKYFPALKARLMVLDQTLEKYNALISVAGVDLQDLRMKLKDDFKGKSNTLDDIRASLYDGHDLTVLQVRQKLIQYLEDCIAYLNDAKKELKKYTG